MDWIRVIVTMDLIPFHVAWLITCVAGFSSVERETLVWKILKAYVYFISPLHMYLLFFVAGASTFIALQYRSPGQYLKERIRRLLVPMLTFVVFLFPALAYFYPSGFDLTRFNYFTEIWPHCLITSIYNPNIRGPNWAHMWFVGYLFLYSLVLLPVFLRIQRGKAEAVSQIKNLLTGGGGAIFLAAIPIALTFAVLSPIWPFFQNNLYTDWGYFAYNLTGFFFGFLIISDRRFDRVFDRYAWISLVLGIVFSAIKLTMEFQHPGSTPSYRPGYMLYSLIAGFNTWSWVIFIISLSRKTLSFSNRFLSYFNRISYPFYIFHLVVIVIAGHFITRLKMGITMEFVIICTASFVISMLCCELVKKSLVTRFMFGIKNG